MMKNVIRIAVLPGDGVGPEVTAEALKVLRAAEARFSTFTCATAEFSVGANEYLKSGDPLPEATFEKIREFDAILLGAMGLPGVRYPNGVEMTPQLDLRERLDLFAGVRPIRLYHPSHSPLKNPGPIDFVFVRESTEGLFHGRKRIQDLNAPFAEDIMRITRESSLRLFRYAFELARRRRRKVSLVDKANVLPSMAYFRAVFDSVAPEFPDVETERIYVDAASLYLVQKPASFDVIVTENMFGDILSDLAAGLIGGMGLAPSGDIGDKHAVFQPSHGSAPDIAGQGTANPTATIVSAAMMLDWLPHPDTRRAASLIQSAVTAALFDPANRTCDLGGTLPTSALGDIIARQVADLPLP